jgi:malonate transporter and related proteins
MQAILAVTVPFFALVLFGFAAAHRRVLPEAAIPGLNSYVLYFALPCLLFRFGANTPVLELLNPAVLLVYVSCALLVVFFTVAMTLSDRVSLKDAAFGALVAAFPNTGFMGVPLLVALMGPAAAGPVICTVLADLLVTSSLCIALAQAKGGPGGAAAAAAASTSPLSAPVSARPSNPASVPAVAGVNTPNASGLRAAVWRALRGAMSNPLPWSIAIGVVFSVNAWALPGPIKAVVSMLADSASPVALFTIGAVLWRSTQHAAQRTPVVDYAPVALIKLVVHPALVLLVAASARSLGAPLSGFQITVLTLAAALPSASNVSLLAERYGANNGRVARIIMASTVCAFVSFSGLAWWLGVRPA